MIYIPPNPASLLRYTPGPGAPANTNLDQNALAEASGNHGSLPVPPPNPTPYVPTATSPAVQGEGSNSYPQPDGQATPATQTTSIVPSKTPDQSQPVDFSKLPGFLNTPAGYGGSGGVDQTNYRKALAAGAVDSQNNTNNHLNILGSLAQGFQASSKQLEEEGQGNLIQQQVDQDRILDRQRAMAAEHKDRMRELDLQFQDAQRSGIDPNRMWKNLNTGGKIGTAIGLLLSGVGAAGNHGVNTAVGVMTDAIDRDVGAQKEDMKNRLSILGSRLGMENTGFDQQSAMIKAERDASYQGYSNVLNQLQTKRELHKDNLNAQVSLNDAMYQVKDAGIQKGLGFQQSLFALDKEKYAAGAAARAQQNAGKLNPAQTAEYRATAYREFIKDGKTPDQARDLANEVTISRLGGVSNPPATSGTDASTAGENANTASARQLVGGLTKPSWSPPTSSYWNPEDAAHTTSVNSAVRLYIESLGGKVNMDSPSVQELISKLNNPLTFDAARDQMLKDLKGMGQQQTSHPQTAKQLTTSDQEKD
jgi:hypothetical protein